MANTQRAIALQALIRAHNNALKRRNNTWREAGNLMTPCMGNICLNFPRPQRTPNQQRLIRNARNANRAYETAYRRLKNALGQPIHVGGNNNNLYNVPNYAPNHRRRTSNASWNLGNAGRMIRAATIIQKSFRGERVRSRTGLHNPYTNAGQLFLYSKMKGRSVREVNEAARRIQRAFRRHLSNPSKRRRLN